MHVPNALPTTLRVMVALALALVALALLQRAVPVQAAPPTYYPSGPQTGVDESALVGWTVCYQTNYNTGVSDPANDLDTVLANCDGEYLLLGGKPVGSTVFDVLAAAPRADVIFDTGTSNTPHNANGSGWYFDDDFSWGFALEGDPINRTSCDIEDSNNDGHAGVNGELRLCWHTVTGAIDGGWRSGLNDQLQAGIVTHERFIYEPSAVPAYYPFGPQTDVDESMLDSSWSICYQTNYQDDFTDPRNDLATIMADCDGAYLMLAGRPVGSTVFDVLAAAPRDDVFFPTTAPSGTHNANGSEWYFNGDSWGFAPGGASISQNSCDIVDSTSIDGNPGGTGASRLCWHTNPGIVVDSGWRSGLADFLQDVTTHERFIYESNGAPVPEPEEPGVIEATSLQFGGVFFLLAHLELPPESDGIRPTSEPLVLQLGENEIVFPPGDLGGSSFFATGATLSDGVVVQVWLIQVLPGRYLLLAFGYGAEPFDDDDVSVEIGDDQFLPEDF